MRLSFHYHANSPLSATQIARAESSIVAKMWSGSFAVEGRCCEGDVKMVGGEKSMRVANLITTDWSCMSYSDAYCQKNVVLTTRFYQNFSRFSDSTRITNKQFSKFLQYNRNCDYIC